MSRKTAREDAFKLLFEYSFQPDRLDEILTFYFTHNAVSENDRSYIQTAVRGVAEHQKELDETIARYAKGWRVDRIARVSLALLRLCIFEMKYCEDIPVSVSIHEALTLAETYEGEKAKPFLNGILGAIDRENAVQKSEGDKAPAAKTQQ